jgi:hypothetical protein
MKMTFDERIEHYLERGFDREQAQVLVLMPESTLCQAPIN